MLNLVFDVSLTYFMQTLPEVFGSEGNNILEDSIQSLREEIFQWTGMSNVEIRWLP